jgi:hypothetical protein
VEAGGSCLTCSFKGLLASMHSLGNHWTFHRNDRLFGYIPPSGHDTVQDQKRL